MTIANVNPNLFGTMTSPVMESRRWIEGMIFLDDKPLINVSQAAPVDPPPAPLREALADAVLNDVDCHLYGAVFGMDTLRKEVAHQWTTSYRGELSQENVGITSGCNQAFCAAISSLCGPGDAVILPAPWYFNHKMWLDMSGVTSVPLPAGPDLLPDVGEAAKLITARTRAIALVSPNNPAGVEYPAELLLDFYELAKAHGIALIVDETYRDYHSQDGAPHALFSQPNALDTFIHLYSFSKAFRLTGHRIGALITSKARLGEIEKFLDTVAICPGQIGQAAAVWGLENLSDWLAEERNEIIRRCGAIKAGFPTLAAKGWELKSAGAYFAYMKHPFDISSADLAPRLVSESGILCLPGTMFCPTDDPSGAQHLRIAFANLDANGIATLYQRLAALNI